MDYSHRRKNILTGEWVQVSPHRTKRPWLGKTESVTHNIGKEHDSNCYLCAGNERANGAKNPDYKDVFIFQNDFAALQENLPNIEIDERSLLQAKSEKGICKVVCFSPKHNLSLAQMSVIDIEKIVIAWQTEYIELGKLPFINHVQIFENKGDIMGCSNPHPHGQIWAQESLPQEVVKEQVEQEKYYVVNKQSLLLDYVLLELEKRERIVFENQHFVVLVPYWAVWPFETMILPKSNLQSLGDLSPAQSRNFAEAIQVVTAKYDKVFDCSFPYSSGIHQAPTDGVLHPEWQLHMHFYPPLLRSASVKKFMVGYEMMANPQRDFTPEYAAQVLLEL